MLRLWFGIDSHDPPIKANSLILAAILHVQKLILFFFLDQFLPSLPLVSLVKFWSCQTGTCTLRALGEMVSYVFGKLTPFSFRFSNYIFPFFSFLDGKLLQQPWLVMVSQASKMQKWAITIVAVACSCSM